MSQAHALSPGCMIDSFEIESVVGSGAFGITYRAFDQVLHRTVAIKEYCPAHLAHRASDYRTLAPRTTSDTEAYAYGLEGFLREARTLAQFHEPNIVRVSRYMEANSTAYFVMDFEEGQPLSEVLNRLGRLSQQQLHALLVHVLRGLSAVHSRDFLHRDIKPSNILIRQSGPPVLLDFGAARQSLEQRAGTLTVVLTPGYAPLEQYGGDQDQGPWSDLYALGATCYHCVLGEKPSGSMERVAALHAGQPDPVALNLPRLRQAVDHRIADAIESMLMLHADDRPAHARDVLRSIMKSRDVAFEHPSQQSAVPLPASTIRTAAGPGSGRPATSASLRPSVSVTSSGYPVPSASPSLRAPSDTPSSQTINEDLMMRAETTLADIVGPIAKVLVKRAAQRFTTRREFCAALADEIDDHDERNDFLKSVR